MSRLYAAAVLACALALVCTAADARPKLIVCDDRGCGPEQPAQRVQRGAGQSGGGVVVSHPVGCPRRLFCGCGVSVRVFGKPIRNLYRAKNWLHKFPRARPASGMVAYRSRRGGGHVAYIKQYLGDGMAVLYDPNSGGGRTRIHTRSIAGWIVVDPHGSRMAGL